MNDYVILVDSTADLEKSLRDEYNIDYCQMGVVVNVGKDSEEEIPADLDWNKYSSHEFYDMMRQGVKMKTTQVSFKTFEEKFKFYLEQGKDVLYISCSSALSGSVNTAELVKNEIVSNYPNAKIVIVDSLCSSLGQGMMAMKASELRKEGKTIEEVATWIEENRLKVNQFCTVADLNYLKRAGRVKATAAFFGNIIGVKPIIISDKLGNNYAFKKVKGKMTAYKELVALSKDAIENPKDSTVWVCHADAQEDCSILVDLIQKEICPKEVKTAVLGPIIGVSTGPGTVAIFVYGKKVDIVGE